MLAKEIMMYRIIVGGVYVNVNGTDFFINVPTPECKLKSMLVYESVLRDAYFCGIISKKEMLDYLIREKFISENHEESFKSMVGQIDNIKENMYLSYKGFKSNTVETLRKRIHKIKKNIDELYTKVHMYDRYTCEGIAEEAAFHSLILDSIDNVQNLSMSVFTEIVSAYVRQKLSDDDIRQVAKLQQWRTIWRASSNDGVFGMPSCLLSDEQKCLIGWSKLYDNVYENTERPKQEVIDDDDLLDGWLIVQHKKGEKERISTNDNSDVSESYYVAETEEDAKRINQMNDVAASFVKKQRMAAITKRGKVDESNLPDVKQVISMKAVNQFRDRMKGK